MFFALVLHSSFRHFTLLPQSHFLLQFLQHIVDAVLIHHFCLALEIVNNKPSALFPRRNVHINSYCNFFRNFQSPPPRTSGDLRCSLSLTTPPRKRTKGVTLQISLGTKWPNVESASLPGRRLVAMADSDGGVCFSCTSVLKFSKNRFLNLFEDVKSTDEVRTKRILDWLSFEVYHILILTKRLQS